MRSQSLLVVTPLLGVLLGGFTAGDTQRANTQAPTAAPAPAAATARIVAAAQALVATLDDAGKTKVQFPFEGPQKARWSNLPTGIFKREGLRLGDLTPAQRKAVTTLLTTALSSDGYRKVTEIMRGDKCCARVSVAAAVDEAVKAVARRSAKTSSIWRSSGRRPRQRRGCCSLAVTTSPSI